MPDTKVIKQQAYHFDIQCFSVQTSTHAVNIEMVIGVVTSNSERSSDVLKMGFWRLIFIVGPNVKCLNK